MEIAIIFASDLDGVIGINSRLPWKQKADLQYFKKLTMGHHILMGRKTFESLPGVLPGRPHIVLSKNTFQHPNPNVFGVNSFEEALATALKQNETVLFVAGGAQIFDMALPYADTIYHTLIHAHCIGDVFWKFPKTTWKCIRSDFFTADADNQYDYTFEIWKRQ